MEGSKGELTVGIDPFRISLDRTDQSFVGILVFLPSVQETAQAVEMLCRFGIQADGCTEVLFG
jgi:hypothetical protein